MPDQEKEKQIGPGLGREIGAVAGIFFAAFVLLSLLSLALHAGMPVPVHGVGSENWGGPVGHEMAKILGGMLGISSLWVFFLLFFVSFRLLTPDFSCARLPFLIFGCTGIVLASCGLVSATGVAGRKIFGVPYYMGGVAGEFLLRFLSGYFGRPGAVLVLLALLSVSMIGVLRFSVYTLFAGCSSRIRGFLARHKEDVQAAGIVAPRLRGGREAALFIKEPAAGLVSASPLPRMHEPMVRENDTEREGFQTLSFSGGGFTLPSLALLQQPVQKKISLNKDHFFRVSRELEAHLKNFGVQGTVEGIAPGSLVTTYEFSPAPGVKINKIVSLADDLALVLKVESVRIVGSIPGKAALGIEIPNPERQTVCIREILVSDAFRSAASPLTIALGLDVAGEPVCADLTKMPHLLIAGATGSGKSVAINTILTSILYKSTPDAVRLLLVDPKRIELSMYENIPHLLHPVVVEAKMASRALQWAVREMERRYILLEEKRAKNLASYNEVSEEKLPLILVVVDELADLMMVASRDVEDAIARLAQMARAAGIHLILATQRPSVDVLTGLIKANFPTRISFKVSSKVDSRTILDTSGAEHLLGAGDMLFLAPGAAKLRRIHGAFVSEPEIHDVVEFLKSQAEASYDESVLQEVEREEETGLGGEEEYDEKYDEAVAFVTENGQASISMLQRRFRVGYNRAARMIETMEKEGVVGPADGARPRQVIAARHEG